MFYEKIVILLLFVVIDVFGTEGELKATDSAAAQVVVSKYKVKSWGTVADKVTTAPKIPTKYPVKSFGSDSVVKSINSSREVKSLSTAADKTAAAPKNSWAAVDKIAAAPKVPTKYPVKSFGTGKTVEFVDPSKAASEVAQPELKPLDVAVVVAKTDSSEGKPTCAPDQSVVAEVKPVAKTPSVSQLKPVLKKISEIRGKILANESKISKILNSTARDGSISDARLVNLTKAVDLYGKMLSWESEIATLLRKVASDQESIGDRIAALDRVTELYDNVSALENQVNKLLQ
jgi:hypothetical protein